MSAESYRAAGVDRDAAQRAKDLIGEMARSTFTKGVLGDIGAFGSFFQVTGFKDPVLVSHTDGVGTKLKIAALLGRYDTVGEDLVHHCVNDIFTCGAKPLFFLDYIAMGKLVPERVQTLVKGMARACRRTDCALIGGETAEMPGVYHGDDFDLVGFVVGAAEKEELKDGRDIQEGDVLLGIPSSGLHTNGYSLVRRIFGIDDDPKVLGRKVPELGHTLGEELLIVHRCYYPLLATVLEHIKSMAHITGGGLLENVPRILPGGLGALFHQSAWRVPPIFRLIQARGSVEPREMHRVFNMGIGLVVVVGQEQVASVQAGVPEAQPIGEVVKVEEGQERVVIEGA